MKKTPKWILKKVLLLLQGEILADHGLTPLHAAAWEGRTEAVEWLIANGADIEAERKEPNKTAILIAAERGHLDIVQLLAKSGADPDTRTEDNHSPLHAAAWNGHGEIVRWLLQSDVDIEAVMSKSKRRPLHWAAERGHLEAVRILLDAGANPHAEADNAYTPRMLALHYEHKDVASLIRSYSGDQ
ncbi:MAG: ankyrin repeat domain-containing protein [Proteobacteria bacterium]|nr:ankyrin repeat domain-containing protein [Pseudomonadota bacterium]